MHPAPYQEVDEAVAGEDLRILGGPAWVETAKKRPGIPSSQRITLTTRVKKWLSLFRHPFLLSSLEG